MKLACYAGIAVHQGSRGDVSDTNLLAFAGLSCLKSDFDFLVLLCCTALVGFLRVHIIYYAY